MAEFGRIPTSRKFWSQDNVAQKLEWSFLIGIAYYFKIVWKISTVLTFWPGACQTTQNTKFYFELHLLRWILTIRFMNCSPNFQVVNLNAVKDLSNGVNESRCLAPGEPALPPSSGHGCSLTSEAEGLFVQQDFEAFTNFHCFCLHCGCLPACLYGLWLVVRCLAGRRSDLGPRKMSKAPPRTDQGPSSYSSWSISLVICTCRYFWLSLSSCLSVSSSPRDQEIR